MMSIQTGGFTLSDESEKYMFKSAVKQHFKKFGSIFVKTINQELNFDDKPITLMDNQEYLKIYQKLTNDYMNDLVYEQQFTTATEVFYEHKNVHSYHICFGALIFISFLLEFELFALIYRMLPYNYASKPNLNQVEGIFAHAADAGTSSKYRVYRDIIRNTPEKILEIFTQKLDDFLSDL